MKNRYIFFKRLYPNYGIFFLKNNKYYSLGIDKIMLNYLTKISYLIIQEDNTVIIKERKKNEYANIYQKIILIKLIRKIY